jgi:hypothetical protein
MGDAQIFARTACFNADVASFFTVAPGRSRRPVGRGAFSDVAPNRGDDGRLPVGETRASSFPGLSMAATATRGSSSDTTRR